jgi:hypothetical protein
MVHSIPALHIAVQQKSAYTDFQSIRARRPAGGVARIEPIVSSTSFIGGLARGGNASGFFPGSRRADKALPWRTRRV